MSIIRTKQSAQRPSVRLKTTILNDPHLSFRAKGLYAFFMAMPPAAHVSIDQLAAHSPGEDQDAIRRAVQALFEAGYMQAEDLFS